MVVPPLVVAEVIEAPVEAAPEPIEAEIVMPRAPEPLSEDEIADAMAVIAARNEQVAGRASVLRSAVRDSSADMIRELDLPLIENVSLAALAQRFEQGIAKREAVVHAEDAQHSLSSSIAYVQPDDSVRTALRAHSPVELVQPVSIEEIDVEEADDSALRVDEDVEQALNDALATLRKLTEQGRR